MSMSANPSHYEGQIRPILDAALAQGGVRYELVDYKAAVRWRFKAYHYRNLLHKTARQGLPKEIPTSTLYDNLVISVEGSAVVVRTEAPPEGRLTTLSGAPIGVGEVPTDEMEDMVNAFKAERLTK